MKVLVIAVALAIAAFESASAQMPKKAQLVEIVTRMAKIGRAGSPTF